MNSLSPVWRDSDELLEVEHAATSSSYPWTGAQKSPDRPLPSLATRRISTKLAGSRSVFSLDPTLRRKNTPNSTCVSGKLRTKHKAPVCDGKAHTKAASSPRKRTNHAAVWKDALEVPRGMLLNTERSLKVGADAERPSEPTTVHGFSEYQPETQDSVRIVFGGPVPLRFPPGTKKREPPPLRRMMHPLRARKVGRGARSKTLTFHDALPIVVQHRPRVAHIAQTRGRLFRNGRFLSLASSPAAVWKSIAFIPEDPPTPSQSRASGLPHRKGRENTQQRTVFSEGHTNVAVSPRIPPGPWKTPPFS